MKVFVINLERSPDRRAYMSDQLRQQSLDFDFITATDYKHISDPDYDRLCAVDAVRNNPFFTKGVLACALSHVEAYKRVIAEDLDMALILEDDVALGKDFKDLLALVESEIKKDEIISFIYFSHYGDTSYLSNIDKKPLNNQYSLVYPVNIEEVSCAMAYVVTKEVARRMLGIAVPVYGPADYWGGFFKRKVFTSFRCVSPVPVEPASFRSVINYAASKTIKSRIAAFVRKNKIPVLYSFLQKKDKSFIDQKSKIVFCDDLPFNYQRG
jgi:glycosyl transferase, family 25